MSHPDAQSINEIAGVFIDGLADTRTYEQDVPERFAFDVEEDEAKAVLEPRVLVGDKVTYGRLARVDCGPRAQALSVLVAPRLATTLPLLNLEVQSNAAGVELVVLDLYQTAASDVSMRLREHLEAARSELAGGFSLEDASALSGPIFDDAAIVMRPGAQSRARVAAVEKTLVSMLEHYTDTIGRYEPTVLRGVEFRRRRRAEYLEAFAQEAPLRGLLEQLRAQDWVDAFIDEFLFPEWLLTGDCLPPWLSELAR